MGNSCSLTTVGISGEDGNWTRWKKGYTLMSKCGWGVEDTRWQMSYKKSPTTSPRKSNPAKEKQ